MRGFAAISVALSLCAAPALARPRGSVAAARKAERRGEWQKALRAWKAAYAKEGNAEYLIAIGDVCSRLGRTEEARKSYERYLADPLARPSNIAKVNTRIARLVPPPMSLPLPGVAPAAAVAVVAKKETVPAPPPYTPPAVVAPRPDSVPPPRESAPPPAKLAVATVPQNRPAPMAAASPAPMAAVLPAPLAAEQQRSGSGRVQRTMAYATAVVALAALGGGVLMYRQADSTHGELTGGIHSPADTQRMLENEQRYRTLSVIGVAGGLVLAGVATAFFAF